MRRALLVVPLLFLCSSAALGAGEREQRVRHGDGIGKFHLGMSIGQARKAMGPWQLVSRREQRSGGRLYLEYQWNFAAWTVGFLGSPGNQRAVRISTTRRVQRTAEGLGVGSTSGQLARRLAPLTCKEDIYNPKGIYLPLNECIHRLPNGRQTSFILEKWNDKVAIVEVRARGCDFFGRNCRAR